jgi:hypothetical protein
MEKALAREKQLAFEREARVMKEAKRVARQREQLELQQRDQTLPLDLLSDPSASLPGPVCEGGVDGTVSALEGERDKKGETPGQQASDGDVCFPLSSTTPLEAGPLTRGDAEGSDEIPASTPEVDEDVGRVVDGAVDGGRIGGAEDMRSRVWLEAGERGACGRGWK